MIVRELHGFLSQLELHMPATGGSKSSLESIGQRIVAAYVAIAIIWFAAAFGVLALAMIVARFPKFCCEWCRAVRYLPWVGAAYYGIALAALALASAPWNGLLAVAVFALLGGWLLPNPIDFFRSPRKRRAVMRAIEHLEAQKEPVDYDFAIVIGSEQGRTIVSAGGYICKMRRTRYFAVDDESAFVSEIESPTCHTAQFAKRGLLDDTPKE